MSLARVAEEYARAIENAADLNELANAVEAIAREMGFRYFALTHHVDIPRAPQPAVRLDNYPPDWVAFFDAQRLGPSDPVHRASQLTNAGFCWSDLANMIDLSPRDRDILRRSRRAGIGDGFTVPAHVPGESAGSCSFATAKGKVIRVEWLPLVHHVGALAFNRARQLSGIRELAADRPRLTDRQRDCLFWAARGKTDYEIAIILGLSHETVIQHVKQARGRYGIAKRAQLAVHALFDGTLSFVDLLRR